MIYPIVAYGSTVLKKKAKPIEKDYEGLNKLVEDMFETMHASAGVGLAAPQISLPIRLFIVDATPFKDEDPELEGFRRIIINPTVIEETGDKWRFNEGCLSIPGIREDVMRNPVIELKYHDLNFEEKEETFTGLAARIIQHEYDHLEGILFTDRISALKRQILKGKLNDITKGKVDVEYKMKFPNIR